MERKGSESDGEVGEMDGMKEELACVNLPLFSSVFWNWSSVGMRFILCDEHLTSRDLFCNRCSLAN